MFAAKPFVVKTKTVAYLETKLLPIATYQLTNEEAINLFSIILNDRKSIKKTTVC
jgi:hypothetical protein